MRDVLTATNLKIIGIGLLLLAVAYVLLAQGPDSNPLSRDVAPVILVIAYCAVIPVGIAVWGKKKNTDKS